VPPHKQRPSRFNWSFKYNNRGLLCIRSTKAYGPRDRNRDRGTRTRDLTSTVSIKAVRFAREGLHRRRWCTRAVRRANTLSSPSRLEPTPWACFAAACFEETAGKKAFGLAESKTHALPVSLPSGSLNPRPCSRCTVAACTSPRRGGSGAEDVEAVFFACRRVRNRFQTRGGPNRLDLESRESFAATAPSSQQSLIHTAHTGRRDRSIHARTLGDPRPLSIHGCSGWGWFVIFVRPHKATTRPMRPGSSSFQLPTLRRRVFSLGLRGFGEIGIWMDRFLPGRNESWHDDDGHTELKPAVRDEVLAWWR
jgi:hypothetical protein